MAEVHNLHGAVRFASAQDAETLAEELPEQFLMCRELSHAFVPFHASMDVHGVIERTLRCIRCQTKRIMTINAMTGEVLYSKYEYPEGYLLRGMGRLAADARNVIRRASLRNTARLLEVG